MDMAIAKIKIDCLLERTNLNCFCVAFDSVFGQVKPEQGLVEVEF